MEIVLNDFMKNPEKITDVFLITKKFNTASEFSQYIERRAYHTKSSCLDVIIEFCSTNEIELESIHKIITLPLKEKIQVEAQNLNMLKIKKPTSLEF